MQFYLRLVADPWSNKFMIRRVSILPPSLAVAQRRQSQELLNRRYEAPGRAPSAFITRYRVSHTTTTMAARRKLRFFAVVEKPRTRSTRNQIRNASSFEMAEYTFGETDSRATRWARLVGDHASGGAGLNRLGPRTHNAILVKAPPITRYTTKDQHTTENTFRNEIPALSRRRIK